MNRISRHEVIRIHRRGRTAAPPELVGIEQAGRPEGES
jgi:hypothetical protein